MIGGVIHMDDYRPHVVIHTGEAVHVYPLSYFDDLADGRDVEPLPDAVLRTIMRSWANERRKELE